MIDWEEFYGSYPLAFGPTEYLKQAGHTVDGEPISDEQFELILARMHALLDLQQSDTLLDLCCGNGVFTKKLAEKCARVVGVDFSKPLLEVAERDHCPDNVTYHLMNALDVSPGSSVGSTRFDKAIMCGALQHFEPGQLEALLTNLVDVAPERRVILFMLVPDRRKKWAFYDTLMKRVGHLFRRVLGTERMGTWWSMEEVNRTCRRLGLHCSFHEMDARLHVSQYRFDIRIT